MQGCRACLAPAASLLVAEAARCSRGATGFDTHARDHFPVASPCRHRGVTLSELLILKTSPKARFGHILAVSTRHNGIVLLDLNCADAVSFSEAEALGRLCVAHDRPLW